MIQTSTHNEIIRYLYDETTEEENENLKNDLIFNEEARNFYYELASVKDSLNKSFKSPKQRTIDNILNYSKSLNLHPVHKEE
jgi:hypothetical protein